MNQTKATNDTRILARRSIRIAVFSAFLGFVNTAYAVDGTPPPSPPAYTQPAVNGSVPAKVTVTVPETFAGKNGMTKWDIDRINQGINRELSRPVTYRATDGYGNKVSIPTTQTKTVSNSKLVKGMGAAWVGTGVADAVKSSDSTVSSYLSNGDYLGASIAAVSSVGGAVDRMFGGLGTYLGNEWNKVFNDYQIMSASADQLVNYAHNGKYKAIENGDLSSAIVHANAEKAANKARDLSSRAVDTSAIENAKYVARVEYSNNISGEKGFYYVILKSYNDWFDNFMGCFQTGYLIKSASGVIVFKGDCVWYDSAPGNGYPGWYGTSGSSNGRVLSVTPEIRQEMLNQARAAAVNTTPEDFFLNQSEIEALINTMLQTSKNQQELINQLAKINNGGLIENATDSNSFSPVTVLSDPYTPDGSNTPVQTKFTVNQDGSVTTETVQRNDLKPNSYQAPTRVSTSATNTTAENSQNFCTQNPTSPICNLPDTSYEDLSLGQHLINIDLNPLNVFDSSAACPADVSFTVGGSTQFFSYAAMCETALRARPWVVALSMLAAFMFVFTVVGFKS